MKKIIILVTALIVALTLCACSTDNLTKKTTEKSITSEVKKAVDNTKKTDAKKSEDTKKEEASTDDKKETSSKTEEISNSAESSSSNNTSSQGQSAGSNSSSPSQGTTPSKPSGDSTKTTTNPPQETTNYCAQGYHEPGEYRFVTSRFCQRDPISVPHTLCSVCGEWLEGMDDIAQNTHLVACGGASYCKHFIVGYKTEYYEDYYDVYCANCGEFMFQDVMKR